MLAGRPHEAVGNGSPRWMAVGPRKRVHRTRPTGQLARCPWFLWHFTLVEAVFGTRYGMAANNVTKADHDWFAVPGAGSKRSPGDGQDRLTLCGHGVACWRGR